MNELSNDVTGLTLEQLGSEVRILTRQAKQMVLGYGVEIGRRLAEAKERVPYGQWGDWVADQTEFSQATATRFMRLYQEYGNKQLGFFGAEVESSTLQNLSVSNALRLLAVPEEERESAALELDAEHVSARELEAAIKERDEAKAREKALTETMENLVRERDADEGRAEALTIELTQLEAKVAELEARPVEVAVEVDEAAVKQAAEDAKAKAEKKAAGEIKALEERLKLAEQQKAAAEAALGEAKTAGAAASKEAVKAAEAAKAEAEALRKQLLAAQSGAGEAIIYCRTAQENFALAVDKITAMRETHPETAETLMAGLEQILSAMAERLREATV